MADDQKSRAQLIEKPFRIDDLAPQIREALDAAV